MCFLLSSLGPSHYTLGNPCSEGSEAKGNLDKFPLQALFASPQLLSLPSRGDLTSHPSRAAGCLSSSREAVRLQTVSPELFLPYSSVFPYPTAKKRGAVILHLQARASSMQVSTLLLSCQPWLILQFSTSRLLEAERFCGSLGVVQGHLQTTLDSGCERLRVLPQSMGCVGHWLGSSLRLHGQNPVLSLQ